MVTKNTQNMIARNKQLDISLLKAKLKDVRVRKYGRPTEFKTKKSFAPSNLGFVGQCPRHWWYAFNGVVYDEKFNEQYALAAENGKMLHTMIQEEYLEAFAGTHIEVKVATDIPPIYGFADIIFELNEDGDKTLIDIKSIKDEKFKMLEATLKPDPGNSLQVLIYMYIKKIRNGLLHYVNKNTHEELFFPLTMNERNLDHVRRALSWMENVHKNALEGEMPVRPFEKTSWHCKFCPLSKTCWSDNNQGTIDIEPLRLDS